VPCLKRSTSKVIKSGRVGRAGYVVCVEERNVCRLLVAKPEGKIVENSYAQMRGQY
jgi:hypothetical protein